MTRIAAMLALLLFAPLASGETASALHDQIAAADRKLFDAFNARDIDTVAVMFDRSLEFYHDRAGRAGYEQTIRQLRENFARPDSPRRELVAGTMEVYPIANYGAIQTGAHRFCHEINGRSDCGVFKFVHVWRNEGGTWKITRVISYDH